VESPILIDLYKVNIYSTIQDKKAVFTRG